MTVRACPTNEGWLWYKTPFLFHKKNFWVSVSLAFFVVIPNVVFSSIPFIGTLIGTVVSIFATAGYLISIDRVAKGEAFKSDFLWSGFTDLDLRKKLIPWIIINGLAMLAMTGALVPLFSLQEQIGKNPEEVFALIVSTLGVLFLVATVEVTFFFVIIPIVVFKKTGVKDSIVLSYQGMQKNLKPLLYNGLLGGVFVVVFFAIGAAISIPIMKVVSNGNYGLLTALSAGLFSFAMGMVYLLGMLSWIFPILALMPYFVYQSIYGQVELESKQEKIAKILN